MSDERIEPGDRDTCLRVLATLTDHPEWLVDKSRDDHTDLASVRAAVNRLIEAIKGEVRARRGQPRDGLSESSRSPEPPPRPPHGTKEGLRCYSCRRRTKVLDLEYDLPCPTCGDRNRLKRAMRVDLAGMRAVVTGGRIRIGHRIALRLLRCGALVEVTTRYPATAARRFADQPDATDWLDRLRIHGLDFHDLRAVCAFADGRAAEGAVEILINNAAQTVRPSQEQRTNALAAERAHQLAMSDELAAIVSSTTSNETAVAVDGTSLVGLDEEGEPFDLRESNSWTQRIGEVPRAELLEVHAANSLAPYLLLDGLLPAMRVSSFERRFVVNVSAAEGRFSAEKRGGHPHTNMAKAALNMLTRTVATDLARESIYVNSVDPGWVSDQFPRGRERDENAPPLTPDDGAARVLDPILLGVDQSQPPPVGKLLKDFEPVTW